MYTTQQSTDLPVARDREKAIDQLNKFLRGELSAVDTYRIAIEKMKSYNSFRVLEQCLGSHEERVLKLRRAIVALGGEAADSGGAWGAFAKLVEGSAALFGEQSAVSALEEGEDLGLKQYRDTGDLDPAALNFLHAELLPAQIQTHAALSRLQQSLKAAN